MAASFQAVGVGEASLQGELGGEHWRTDVYLDVCFPGIWSHGPRPVVVLGLLCLALCTDHQEKV